MIKDDAQRRADQIRAFRAELTQLAREGAPPLDETQLAAVAAHHDRLLGELAREFDVDRGTAEKRLSLGMRVASLLGAAALVAAVVSFVMRVWGVLATPAQVALLTAAPLAALLLTIAAGRVEKTRYVASLFAIVACAAVVLQTVMLARLFNLRGSPHVLAWWALAGLAIGLPWRFGVPFAFGVLAAVLYPAALAFEWRGVPWIAVVERPEPAALAAAIALTALPRVPAELARWTRAILLLVVLGTVLVLSATASVSLLAAPSEAVKIGYQLAAVVAGGAALRAGVRRGLPEVTTIASLFLAAFLLLRFVDWWWDWMPKYLFFLILAGSALGWLWALRVARRRLAA